MGRGILIFKIPFLFLTKWLFFFRNSYRLWQLRKKDVLELAPLKPKQLSLEVTNLCNANCTFCAYQYQSRPIQRMSFQVFQQAVKQYAELGGGPLGLTPVVGDALIDKDLEKKVAYARSLKNIGDIGLTTNAILLTKNRFEELIRNGLNTLEISMTGFDRKEYLRIYRNDSYEKVKQNLLDAASSPYFKNCRITLSLRTDSWFPSLRADYRKFKKLGFVIRSTWFFDNWSGQIKQKDLTGRMMVRPSVPKKAPCRMLYSGPTVLADGRLTACGCRDVNGGSELILGKFPNLKINEPWQNGQMKNLRERFLKGDIPDICKDCRHYSPVTASDLAA